MDEERQNDELEIDREERAESASAADPRKDATRGPEGRQPGGQPRRAQEEQAAGDG